MSNPSRIYAALCFAMATAAAHAGLLDWTIKSGTGAVMSGKAYTLYNNTDKENLRYGSRSWGINLVWDKNIHYNVRIEHQTPGGPIVYGEPVAIYIKDGGYLKYEKRSFGINLGWSSKPVYEWKLGGSGGPPGSQAKVLDMICLVNSRAQDCVIYDTRKVGIDLIWSKDKGKMGWSNLLNDVKKFLGNPGQPLVDWINRELGYDK